MFNININSKRSISCLALEKALLILAQVQEEAKNPYLTFLIGSWWAILICGSFGSLRLRCHRLVLKLLVPKKNMPGPANFSGCSIVEKNFLYIR